MLRGSPTSPQLPVHKTRIILDALSAPQAEYKENMNRCSLCLKENEYGNCLPC